MMNAQLMELPSASQLLDRRLTSLCRLRTEDAEAVVPLYQNLTDRDRSLRLSTLHPVHLDQCATKLIEPAIGHYALGAFDADQLICVTNYSVSDDPTAADGAVGVTHEDHQLPPSRSSNKEVPNAWNHRKKRNIGLRRWIGSF
jgi:hypothetical protein